MMALPGKVTRDQVIQSMQSVFDVVPSGKFTSVFRAACNVEMTLRTAVRAFQLLDSIREFILDPSSQLGGERSPFVMAIDELLERPEPRPVDLGERHPDGPAAGGDKGGAA